MYGQNLVEIGDIIFWFQFLNQKQTRDEKKGHGNELMVQSRRDKTSHRSSDDEQTHTKKDSIDLFVSFFPFMAI